MLIIRLFSNFCTSEEATRAFVQSDALITSSRLNTIYRFTTGDDYTHVILINTAMPSLPSSLPKHRVIGTSAEPPYFLGITSQWIDYIKRTVSVYYIGSAQGLPSPFTESFGALPWHCPIPVAIPEKVNQMSIMVSFKKDAPGHRYRHELVRAILSEPTLPIDIYGNGCAEYANCGDPRVKGSFEHNELYASYAFHICIENFSLPGYFSEKISNALLYGCTPIYFGCPQINAYFPDQVIQLSGNVQNDMDLLRKICQQPENYRKTIDCDQVRHVISIERLIDQLLLNETKVNE